MKHEGFKDSWCLSSICTTCPRMLHIYLLSVLRRDPQQSHACLAYFLPQFSAMDAEKILPKAPNDVRFRVLIIGRANAGKTSILQRVCDTTESPEIYSVDESGARNRVCSRPWSYFQSHLQSRLNSALRWRFGRLIFIGDS